MKVSSNSQSGFTAVELLVTLFVASAFLISGFQLFNTVIISGGETRAASHADNAAYSYLRKYAESATTPCTSSTPLASTPITVEGLANPTVQVVITCPVATAPSVSKVQSTVNYSGTSGSKTVIRSVFIKE